MPVYARTLERLMEALGLGAAAFVGNSMGGFTSVELAIAFPERVERLVLVSPAGLSTYNNPARCCSLTQIAAASAGS